MPFTAGQNVGPYRIVEQLGQGGMATVYKAYHAVLDRYVAIKVLHPAFKEDPGFAGRFAREARVVASLDHPNIVPIYDFAEHGETPAESQPYLVMKYIEGETLKARLARGPLAPDEKLKMVEAVGSALAYAHDAGILHRDIKPSNVLLAADGQIYLTDFGLARIAAAGESTLSSDMLLGTPHYISPEQARGERDLDAGTDVYSFGVLLYEVIVGRVPFSADTPFSIIHDHIYTPLPMPRAVNPGVPEALERVLLRALAKDRADRFPDVTTLVEAFRAAARVQLPEAAAPTETPAGPATVSPPPTSAPAPTETPAGPATVSPPPTPAPVPTVQPEPEARPAPPSRPRRETGRKFRWWWVAAGVAGLCLCFFLLTVVAGLSNQNKGKTAETETVVAIQQPEQPASQPEDNPQVYLEMAKEKFDESGRARDAALEAEQAGNQAQAERLARQAEEFHVQAGQAFAEAASLTQHDPGVYSTMVDFLTEQEDPVMALQLLADGLEAHPDNRELRERAFKLMLETTTESDEVLAVYEQYVERFPEWDLPHIAMARWYGRQCEFERAREEIDVVLTLEPDNVPVHLVIAELHARSGDLDAAIKELEAVIDNPAAPMPLKDISQRILERYASDSPDALRRCP